MLRYYRLVHAHKADGVFDLHKSTLWHPCRSMIADAGVEGEQLMSLRPGDKPLAEALPPEVFRAQMTGRQFGLPVDFLAYVKAPFMPHEALGYAVVHGVWWRPWTTTPELTAAARYWHVFDRYGLAEAEFLPYWAEGGAVQVEPGSVLASVWVLARRALVACLSPSETTAAVRVRARSRALPFAEFAVRDAFTGEQLPVHDGAFEFSGFGWTPRLFLLEAR
jgi:hypothetical protein